MSIHYGFSDSDNESANTVNYTCSDPDHCDKGVDCDEEHRYSHETAGLKAGLAYFSESEATVDKPEVECNDSPSLLLRIQLKCFP